ncbi:exo-beta-N-acetylmuramidase NamZ domain-containing protein [Pendulispora albinea]|uniref:DUF1343 domain-containing protein n=1 Tax=Pendulispora albinea TaxID=2741071 RepID=A0ABZ2M0D4_9BACT
MFTGLDRLAAGQSRSLMRALRGTRVALLAHPASVTRDLVHAADVVIGQGARLKVIFGPEHGFGGEAQDMIGVEDARDRNGIPIRSLYGADFSALEPRAEDLADVDLLVVDLQDVGARYYTFVWTALLAVRVCQKLGKRALILDRPNPIGGDPSSIEGRRQQSAFRSFVGLEAIPIRHALTLGEIIAWRAGEEGIPPEQLEVAAVTGLARDAHAPAWDRPFIAPSPNMPTYRTALVYPGACLLEGTNLSEGRGTTQPFEVFGAPWLDGAKLAHDFHALEPAGVRVRPLTFQPMFHKHAGLICGGVQVHVTDSGTFRPIATYVALVALARQQDPARFAFRTEPYEFVKDIPAFDLLTGDDEARILMEKGAPPDEVAQAVSRLHNGDAEIVHIAREAGARYCLAHPHT